MITPIDWPHGISEIFLVITPPSPATSHTHVPSYFPAEHWARSIKPLHEFYSTQAVMHHLWEANFQKPFGFSAPLRCCCSSSLKSSIIVPTWKGVARMHLLTAGSISVWGGKKCKCVLLSTITACLGRRFIENVLCSRTHRLWVCCCSSNKCCNTHQLVKRMDWLRSGMN